MPQKILIIDEDIKFNNLLARRLSLEGYAVSRSFDFKTSLELFHEQSFDIVLLDTISNHDDHSVYTKLIKERYPKVHIIILSILPDIRDCVQSIKNGAEDYIVKDNDMTKLIPLLKEQFTKIETAEVVLPAQVQKDR